MNNDYIPLNVEHLRSVIDRDHIKRTWLAAEVGVDRNTLRRWLKGDIKNVRRKHLFHLADILDCTPDELTLTSPSQLAKSRNDREHGVGEAIRLDIGETLIHSSKLELADSVLRCIIVTTEDKGKQAQECGPS